MHTYYLVHVCDGFSMRALRHGTINLVVATLYMQYRELHLHSMLVAVVVASSIQWTIQPGVLDKY